MKAFIMSDIHLEFYDKPAVSIVVSKILTSAKGCDILIIAGDLTVSTKIKLLEMLLHDIHRCFKHIILVLGNHDYYYMTYDNALKAYKDKIHLSYPNVVLLDNSSTIINNKTIHGTTLFTGNWYDGFDKLYAKSFTDFDEIYQWNIDKLYEVHNKCLSYLYNNVNKGDIVISHHMPLTLCIDLRFINDAYNRFFACHIPELVNRASYWIYGHTHYPNNFVFEDCELFCNPLGYPHVCNTLKNYTIEI